MLALLKLLTSVTNLAGTLGAAVIVVNSGVCLAHSGNDSVSGLSQPANETTHLLRSKLRLVGAPTNRSAFEDDGLEDVVLTFRKQYHLLRLLRLESEEAFLYVVMDRTYANLAMTRHKVCEFERELFEDLPRLHAMEQQLRAERDREERIARNMPREIEALLPEECEDEMPAYLCEDSVRRMLGLTPVGAG